MTSALPPSAREPSRDPVGSSAATTRVLPEHRVVYVPTGLQQEHRVLSVLGELRGSDVDDRRPDELAQPAEIAPGLIDDIASTGHWFVFAFVQDPWTRLWAAWQSTFLQREPRYHRAFADAPFYPRVPEHALAVIEDFQRFVDAHPWTSHPLLRGDPSFAPQTQLLASVAVTVSHIYGAAEFTRFTSDLRTHLRGRGPDLRLGTAPLPAPGYGLPLRPTRAAMAGGVKEAVEELYADDVAAFGHLWDFEELPFAPDDWNDDAIAHAAYHTVANDWIDHVASTGAAWRAERDAVRRELRRARRRLRQLEAAAQRHDQAHGRLRMTAQPTRAQRVAAAARHPTRVIRWLARRLRS